MQEINLDKWKKTLEYFEPIGKDALKDHDLWDVYERTKQQVHMLGPICAISWGRERHQEAPDQAVEQAADILHEAVATGIEQLHARIKADLESGKVSVAAK